jgi:hypothetical protein
MFKPVDPQKNQRMIELFENFCNDMEIKNASVLTKCYKNRLEYGCGYSKEIENVLDSIHKLVLKREGPEDWVSLLD